MKGIPCINWLWPRLCGHPEPIIIAMEWNYPPLWVGGGHNPNQTCSFRMGYGERDIKKANTGGTWLAQSEEHVILGLKVISLRLILGVEITKNINLKKKKKATTVDNDDDDIMMMMVQ